MISGGIASLCGPRVFVSEMLGKERAQVRFPRSKSRRIRRKWAKDPRNWRTTWKRACYQIGGDFYMDPVSFAEFKAATR